MKMNVLSSVISLAATLTTISFASANNGQGYNGPDLNPTSIPVELDRGISTDQVRQAIFVCIAKGDPSTGLQSMLQKLIPEMGSSVFETGSMPDLDSPSRHVGSLFPQQSFWVTGAVEADDSKINTVYPVSYGNGDGMHSQFTVQINDPITQLQVYLTTTTTQIFPYISYDQILQQGGTDAFGSSLPNVVTGLKINVDPTFKVTGSLMPLYNGANQSTFAVNAQEYVQCLQSQLQIQASK